MPQAVSMFLGGTSAVAATVANAPAGGSVAFAWRVRDSAIVVIDSLARGGSVAILRRVAPGGTVVTATVPALGLSAEIPVTVPLASRHNGSLQQTAPLTHPWFAPAASIEPSNRQLAWRGRRRS